MREEGILWKGWRRAGSKMNCSRRVGEKAEEGTKVVKRGTDVVAEISLQDENVPTTPLASM